MSTVFLDPAMIQLIITGLRAGREALLLLKMAKLDELPPEVRDQLIKRRDELDAEFDNLMPPA